MKTRKNLALVAIVAIFGLVFAGLFLAGCESPTSNGSGDTNQTPAVADYDISGLTKVAGGNTGVSITPKDGKSPGAITIHYEGINGTTFTKAQTLPIAVGTYAVTFDVAAADGWNAVTGLSAGTLTVIAVESITIKTQPTNLSYTHGDLLDLTGLVLTLTYGEEETEEVKASEFDDYGITTTPAIGSRLARSTHDGEPVTINCGSLSEETDDLTVDQKDIDSDDIAVAEIGAIVFNNSPHKPEPTVTHGEYTLVLDTDYELEYVDNTNAGQATVTISGIGDYTGETEANFTITPQPIIEADVNITAPVKGETPDTVGTTEAEHFTITSVTWSPTDNPFKGAEIYTVTVTLEVLSDNFTFTGLATVHLNQVDPTAQVSANGKTATVSHTFPATLAKDVSSMAIKTQPQKLTYTYGEHFNLSNLVVTLTYDDTTTDDVAVADFERYGITTIPADGDKVYVKDSGKPVVIHRGSLNIDTDDVTINAKAINDSTITVGTIPAQTYNGNEHKPNVTVYDNGVELDEGEDYTVTDESYNNNINAGTATITITGTGNYMGTKPANFIINPKVTNLTVDPIEAVNFNGSAHEPIVTVKDGTTALTLTTDYTVGYSNNTNAGQATVTITGVGNYAGSSGTEHFTIYPSYKVTFNSNGGTAVGSLVYVLYGTAVTKPNDPTKDGFIFLGWYTDNNTFADKWNFATAVTSNVDLYAKWSLVEMVSISAGTFTMGSPTDEPNRLTDETQHEVTLTKGFYMGKFQVTQEQYQAVMGSNPSYFQGTDELPATGEVQKKRPVEQVSWYDTLVFCNKLSMMEGLTPAYSIGGKTDPDEWGAVPTSSDGTWNAVTVVAESTGYRLPTEAQWEYACRAGTTTAYNTGATINNNTGWYDSNSSSRTHEVGKKPANAWGLYDMHGNVLEWCWDWYDSYASGVQTDPAGASSGSNRVSRGGSWLHEYLGSAVRAYGYPYLRADFLGFRLVCPLSE